MLAGAVFAATCGPMTPQPDAGESSSTSSSSTEVPTGSSEPVTTAVADLPALDPEAVCTALCMQESLCNGTTVSPSCVEGCLEPPGAPPISGECFAASVAYSACLGALDCEERKDPYACEDALRLVLAPCRVCWSNAEVKDDGTCWFHEVCPEWTHHLECDADRCTCAVDAAGRTARARGGARPPARPCARSARCQRRPSSDRSWCCTRHRPRPGTRPR